MNKLNVISMLSQQGVQDEIGKLLKKDGMKFAFPDCESEIELLGILEKNTDWDVLVMYYPVISSSPEQLFIQIREMLPDARIVLIIPQQYRLVEELCSRFRLSAVWERKWVDLEQVCRAIQKGKLISAVEYPAFRPEMEAFTQKEEHSPHPEQPFAPDPHTSPFEQEQPADFEDPGKGTERTLADPFEQDTGFHPEPVLEHTVIGVFSIEDAPSISELCRKLDKFFYPVWVNKHGFDA